MDDADLIESIAPSVLDALARAGFFEALDERMCPADGSQPASVCRGTYLNSTEILSLCGFGPEDISEITQVLAARGGCCDCEILFNVAEESRLKSQYWKARAAGLTPPDSHFDQLNG